MLIIWPPENGTDGRDPYRQWVVYRFSRKFALETNVASAFNAQSVLSSLFVDLTTSEQEPHSESSKPSKVRSFVRGGKLIHGADEDSSKVSILWLWAE